VDREMWEKVVLNLLSNARHAVLAHEPRALASGPPESQALASSPDNPRRITVRGRLVDDARIEISVIDSGVGIPRENLLQVFSFGFTTKKDGHGFGLHSSALAAADMGGRLTGDSEGPGKGATFTLELPLDPRP